MPRVRVTYSYSSTYIELLNVTDEELAAAGGVDNWDPSDRLDPDSLTDEGFGDFDIQTVEVLPDV